MVMPGASSGGAWLSIQSIDEPRACAQWDGWGWLIGAGAWASERGTLLLPRNAAKPSARRRAGRASRQRIAGGHRRSRKKVLA